MLQNLDPMIAANNERTLDDPVVTALAAVGWIIAAPERAERMMSITGLTPDDLRQRIEDPSLLSAVLGFLEGHEPDLIACAEAIDVTPTTLVQARQELER
jgi:hypothetical protein